MKYWNRRKITQVSIDDDEEVENQTPTPINCSNKNLYSSWYLSIDHLLLSGDKLQYYMPWVPILEIPMLL